MVPKNKFKIGDKVIFEKVRSYGMSDGIRDAMKFPYLEVEEIGGMWKGTYWTLYEEPRKESFELPEDLFIL